MTDCFDHYVNNSLDIRFTIIESYELIIISNKAIKFMVQLFQFLFYINLHHPL